ncbi:MAG TPA: hypothetical protein VGC72_01175 [Candidatus Elarobacter sp.]
MDAALDSLGQANLADWTPVRAGLQSGGHIVWARLDEPFTEPFFEQTADRAMRRPFNQIFARRTSLAALDDAATRAPAIPPSGFIFHMSRCGSTLIAQMLAGLPSAVVLSEPQPLDALIRLRRGAPNLPEETLLRWFRGMVSALGRPRRGEQRLFVKFHAWHVLELPFIARAFPGVPWLFVFREPRAVLRSQARNAGPELLAGMIDPAYLGIQDPAELASPDYGARVVASFCDAALRHRAVGRGMFVDYAALPGAVTSHVSEFFALPRSAADTQRMHEAALRDTKAALTAPRLHAPQDGAATVEHMAATWLDAPYAALRALATTPQS